MLIGFVVMFAMVKLALRINTRLRPNASLNQSPGRIKTMIDQLQHSLTKRVITISIVGLAMAIPLTIVEDVVSERGRYYSQVIAEIANLWGHQQVINGPLLVILFIE